jgi:hypothetical protein
METLTKTPLLLQHTAAGTPQSFAATRTFRVPVMFASFEAIGSFTDRGTEGIAAWWKMPSAPGKVPSAGEGPHQEVEVGDAPLDEGHTGVVGEVRDVLPPPGGEVVDDDDVVVLC